MYYSRKTHSQLKHCGHIHEICEQAAGTHLVGPIDHVSYNFVADLLPSSTTNIFIVPIFFQTICFVSKEKSSMNRNLTQMRPFIFSAQYDVEGGGGGTHDAAVREHASFVLCDQIIVELFTTELFLIFLCI
mmetsp:Transcript_17656/g.25542  ORF Transcript_17656/g.25542 Transcript_17656/m.25542 type:complete len:131 (-) Transcript_17656:1263-1655(-)